MRSGTPSRCDTAGAESLRSVLIPSSVQHRVARALSVCHARHVSEPSKPGDVVGKAALGTVTVLVVLVFILCVLPMAICGVLTVFGSSGG